MLSWIFLNSQVELEKRWLLGVDDIAFLLFNRLGEMTSDAIVSAATVPASEFISQVTEGILALLKCANNVLVERESFGRLASYLEKVLPVVKELNRNGFNHPESLLPALGILSQAIKNAQQLISECTSRNKVYLLLNCRAIVNQLEKTTREFGRGLSLIPLASLDVSTSIRQEIGNVRELMEGAEFKTAVAEEEILEKLESGIQERNVDSSYANKLLVLIAEAVGISTERSSLKKEFEEFKNEIENGRLRKDQAEAVQMDQIIALLESADAASSPNEKDEKYLMKRNSLGIQPLEPLRSFYCPITREVMVDPVETSSGQTFERSAIKKWFEGSDVCPTTKTVVDTSVLRPNRTLRQSIQEWKDRNTMIMIASTKLKLESGLEAEVHDSLGWLQSLCQQRDLYRDWVMREGYIPILIELLASRDHDIKTHALEILCMLVEDSDEAKDRVAKVDNAVESIVKNSLGRRPAERKLAVSLLSELSKNHIVRDSIGEVQGCILLLVTMTSSDDSQAATHAKNLLENLSFSDENVIQMAHANYFRHLLDRLLSGQDDVRMKMARTLATMKLTAHAKASLFEDGALTSLLEMVSNGNMDAKQAAVESLENLSSLPANGLQMVREGAVRPLLDLIYAYGASSTKLRKHVAATLMQLAMSTISQDSSRTPVSMLGSSDDISKLFSLINYTAADVQTSILCTFTALCQSYSASNMKAALSQCSAVQVLVQLCENDNLSVQANAVKLLYCLVQDGDKAMIAEHVGQKCIETLVQIISSSSDVEEVACAMGILSVLPEDAEITKWLCDSAALTCISRFLQSGRQNGPHKDQLVENAVGAVCRFTVPESQESQRKAAEIGIIPVLVSLLETGTSLTRMRAAISLAQFSKSTLILSQPVPKRKGWFCFSAPPELTCPVHRGFCTSESTFCLVDADALRPLVRVLGDSDFGGCEASLDALMTLVEGDRLQSGGKALDDAGAIPVIIRLLSSPSTELQEKALEALERISQLINFKQNYGASVRMLLVGIIQRGSRRMKSLAARILGHIDELPDQSSYF